MAAASPSLFKSKILWLFLTTSAVAMALMTARPPAEVSLSAQGLSPILPLNDRAMRPAFAVDLLRDPTLQKRQPEGETDATRLAEEIKELRYDLAHAQGPRALELNEQAYQGLAALSYYLEDLTLGRSSQATPSTQGNPVNQLNQVRSMLQQHAQYVARAGTPGQKAQALFLSGVVVYQKGDQQRAAAVFKKLAEESRGSIAKRAAILSALYDLDHGKPSDRSKAQAVLRQALASSPKSVQVSVRLAMARHEAGLTVSGRKTSQTKPAYRGHLSQAMASAEQLANVDRDAALASAIAIWRAAEGAKSTWSQPPFRMSSYANTPEVRAIIERSALEDWHANKKANAIRKYSSLAKAMSGQATRGDIDLRLLEFRRLDALEHKSPKTYEAALIAANKAYLDPGILGDGQEGRAKGVAEEISRRHKALVYSELQRAETKSASQTDRHQAIRMAKTYLSTLTEALAIEDVKARVAGIYALAGQHREAVEAYKDLAETAKSQKVPAYFAAAIRSQSILAAWPLGVPWQAVKAGHASEREELITLYQKLAEHSGPNMAWPIQAHVGQLERALGRQEQAFARWQELLAKDARGTHAANAAGTMLVAYNEAEAWWDLETLSRLCVSQKMLPVFRGRQVSVRTMLAAGLLGGGKVALEGGKFDVAVAKFKEITLSHQDFARHDEAFFLLAVAYHGGNHHDASIKTMLAFAERYPKSAFTRPALLAGGDWAEPMAYEDTVMFFHDRFLRNYPTDPEAARVRLSLIDLYLGRERYAEAIALLSDASDPKRNPDAGSRGTALAAIMDLEERHGSMGRALQAAEKIFQSSDAPDEAKANAFALKGRAAAARGDYQTLLSLEAKLSSIPGSASEEAIGELRFILAAAEAKTVIKPSFNLALNDPGKTLSERSEAFKVAKARLQHVCDGVSSSFCAPAMVKLSQLSLEFMRSLEDIEVQTTLAKEEVQRFQNLKQGIMNEAARTSQQSDARAMTVMAQGGTDPDWTEAVIWQNSADSNFERVSGEAGNGFVQWASSQN